MDKRGFAGAVLMLAFLVGVEIREDFELREPGRDILAGLIALAGVGVTARAVQLAEGRGADVDR